MTLPEKFTQRYGRLPTEVDSDYLEMLRMNKYRILPAPHFKPGKCANCGSSKEDGRQYIDFGLEVDWYGIVYLCTLCLKDVAKSAGLFESYEEAIMRAQDTLVKTEELRAQGIDLQKVVLKTFEEVKGHFASLHSLSDGGGAHSTEHVEPDEKVASEPRTNLTKSRTTKPNPVRRSTDVPSLAELLNTDS